MNNTLHEWLAAPWVESLGRTLLHFLWQGALLGALAWLGLRLAHKCAASVRYLLAGLLMLALAIAPMATFLVLSNKPAAPGPTLAVSSEQPRPALVLTAPTETTLSPPAQNIAKRTLARPVRPTVPARLDQTVKLAAWWMVPFWLAGVLCMAARLGFGWLRIQRWQRSATPALDVVLLASFKRLSEKFSLGKRVRLLISKAIPGPVTYGWLRPAVLLPAQMLTGLPPELLEALLAHELAHIARRDYLANLVQAAIEVVLFYHPVVWWLGARLREIREECCDEMAVQACGDRLTYARALESLAELQLAAEPAAAASGGNLLARITRIVGRAPETAGSSAIGTLLFLIAVGGLVTFLSVSSTKAQDQTAPASQSGSSQSTTRKVVDIHAQNQTDASTQIIYTDALTGEKIGDGPAGYQVNWFQVNGYPAHRNPVQPPRTTYMLTEQANTGIANSSVDVSSLQIMDKKTVANIPFWESAAQTKATEKKPDPLSGVTVLGEVKKSLVIAIDPAAPITLSDAITQAGWTTYSKHTVELVRKDKEGKMTTTEYDVDAVLVKGNKDKDVVLQPGDMIIVRRNWQTLPPAPAPSGGKTSEENAPSPRQQLGDAIPIIETDALTGEKLTVPSFDSEWNGNSFSSSATVPLTANTLVKSERKLLILLRFQKEPDSKQFRL